MNQLFQDLQLIRSICQQLAQNERQNAQLFAQQPGMQAIAQRESFAANQLQQCVNLCNRVEQAMSFSLQQQQLQQFQQPQFQPQFQQFRNQQQAGGNVNTAVLSQILQGR